MYLTVKKTDTVVLDFQLIYDTDNFLQLDFYAEGYMKFSEIINEKAYFNRTNYGFLIGSYKEHIQIEDKFKALLLEQDFAENTSNKMVDSVKQVAEFHNQIESDLKNRNFNIEIWRHYFDLISTMIAYKPFSDDCEPIYFANDKECYEAEIKKVSMPSHILLFHEKIEELKKNPIDSNIQSFIDNYGFLYDFNIASTPFEDKHEIEKLINKSPNVKPIQNKKEHTNNFNFTESFAIELCRKIAWYEEWRHYHQARALRNYRIALEHLNSDIYRTGIDVFHRKMEGGF